MTIEHEQTLPEFLTNLIGQGIYDIGIMEEFRRYGFEYYVSSDTLAWKDRETTLGARLASEAASEDEDTAIDKGHGDDVVVDALQITRAILRLIAPDYPPPSVGMFNKTKAIKADVGLITRRWRLN